MMTNIRLSILLVTFLLAHTSLAQITLEDFAKHPEVLSPKLSPTGKYLGVIKIVDDKRVLVIFKFPSMKISTVVNLPDRNQVFRFLWVNNDRVIVTVTKDFGQVDYLTPTGEIFAVNADGKKGGLIFGYRAGDNFNHGIRVQKVKSYYGHHNVLDILDDDKKNILITQHKWNRGPALVVEAVKLNVYTGRLTSKVRAPAIDSQMMADRKGRIRFAFSTDDKFNSVIHERDLDTGDWSVFGHFPYGQSSPEPLGFNAKGDKIFVSYAPDEGPHGIYLYDLATKTMDEVYQHEYVDADIATGYADKPYGIWIEPDRPEFITLDKTHPEAQIMERVRAAFPESQPFVASTTRDNKLMIVGVYDDNATTMYYLFDAEQDHIKPLLDRRPWIDDKSLAQMKPIKYKTRDGLEIHGYLTLPPEGSEQDLPLVIMPHGGPHGPRDTWGFDPFVQVMATRGYAVLQVNYRGSGGYGMHFESLGFDEWGKKMQDDLTDATHWAINEGIADEDRLCIYGWSYGGYAALMGIIREPDLYSCAIAGAGVYEMDIQYKKADFAQRTRWGSKYIDQVIGPTAEDRRLASPTTYVDRIKTPLFLVHGEDDFRVPVENAYALIKAMKKVGKKVQYMERPAEGHGFYKPENNVDFFEAQLAFLNKHIGTPD